VVIIQMSADAAGIAGQALAIEGPGNSLIPGAT
jgi:hypothetical protein